MTGYFLLAYSYRFLCNLLRQNTGPWHSYNGGDDSKLAPDPIWADTPTSSGETRLKVPPQPASTPLDGCPPTRIKGKNLAWPSLSQEKYFQVAPTLVFFFTLVNLMVDRAKQLYQLIAHSTIGNRAKSTGQGGGPLVIFLLLYGVWKKNNWRGELCFTDRWKGSPWTRQAWVTFSMYFLLCGNIKSILGLSARPAPLRLVFLNQVKLIYYLV